MLMDVSVFAKVDCSQPSIFSYFYSEIDRELNASAKRMNSLAFPPLPRRASRNR